MAHENLRFNLMLRSGTDPLYGTQATLNPVYSDQAYGTQYGLFADFKPKDMDKVYKDFFDVGELSMRIQNYSGAITLGITKISTVYIKEFDENNEMNEFKIDGFSKRHIKLFVILQSLNNSFEASETISDKEPLTLYNGDLLEILVQYLPAENKFSNIDNVEKNDAFFVDHKYQVRDGEEISNRDDTHELREVIAITNAASGIRVITTNNSEDLDEKLLDVGRVGDPRCKQKMSDIYIV
ncbi:hypothetical protein [Rasiella sp. SM2506]|uniref:hypothetical protein n=1 Tax=Rasiella sp. SM2506 TaxID=3423914 RepID=UPI003D7BB9F6